MSDKTQRQQTHWRIETATVAREFHIVDGQLRTTALTHLPSGQNVATHGPEFCLSLQEVEADSSRFRVVMPPVQTESELVFELEPIETRYIVSVQLRYVADPVAGVIRKYLTIRNDRVPHPFTLDAVDLERLRLEGVPPDCAVEWGQPVLTGPWFWGVEHPAFWVSCPLGEVGLRVAPALVLPPGESATLPPVVLGAGHGQDTLQAFHRYLDTVRAQPPQVFAMMNTWYHAPFINDTVALDALDALRSRVQGPYPGTFDTFTIDDGWDDPSRLWYPHPERFPQGLRPVAEQVQRAGLRFGLWCSPWGGYEHSRRVRGRAGARQGFGTQDDTPHQEQVLCIGEEGYFRYYLGRLVDHVVTSRVSFFKFDGYPYVCNNANHGHPIGRGSVTWNCNRMIEIAQTLRKHAPNIFLLGTIGFWQSPWWLMHLDAVFIGGGDDGQCGEGTPRQRDITYRDTCIYHAVSRMRSRFPISAGGVHGIIKARYEEPYYANPQLAFTDETLTELESLIWTNVGRGVGMVEAYLSPDLLDDMHARILAEGLAFLRTHWQTLRRGRWWGGDPVAGEAYGIVHEGDNETILFVRNPTGTPQVMPHGLHGTVVQLKAVGDVDISETDLKLGPFALTLLSVSH